MHSFLKMQTTNKSKKLFFFLFHSLKISPFYTLRDDTSFDCLDIQWGAILRTRFIMGNLIMGKYWTYP